MAKNPNYFKQFLENSYQDTFIDPTGKDNKNPITKINGCVKNNILLPQNTLVILSNNCYAKMSQSEDLQLYSECLQQYGVSQEQTESIRNCVNGVTPTICYSSASLNILQEGDVEYTDCCGLTSVLRLLSGEQSILECLRFNSVKPYEKGDPAIIGSIEYTLLNCICRK